uniref:Uncharacterized protein n=1 Tax=Anguilla anguilla TaxID=7936 RepID=A0A0E9TFI0_ANGAN
MCDPAVSYCLVYVSVYLCFSLLSLLPVWSALTPSILLAAAAFIIRTCTVYCV